MKSIGLLLCCAAILVGISACSKNNDTHDANTTATGMQSPLCTVTPVEPITDQSVTLQIQCKAGAVPINEATVSIDQQVQSIKPDGSTLNRTVQFQHLQPDTLYEVQLAVVAGEEAIRKTISVRTAPCQKCVFECECCHTFPSEGFEEFVTDLSELCFDTTTTQMSYTVANKVVHYTNDEECDIGTEIPFDPDRDIFIEGTLLRVNHLPPCGISSIDVAIIGSSPNGNVATKITISLSN